LTDAAIDGSTCNGTDTSGCGQTPATIAVGTAPRSLGIDTGTNTVFVGNRDDGTVSVIDGSTCNGKITSGCGQSPATVSVGAPSTACSCFVGRKIAVDQATHLVYVPVIGDSDVAVIDGNACHGGLTSGCRASIVPLRMGGFGTFAAVDPSSGTVYVGNNVDGNVSFFQARNY
jgi:DNA-binding beta-propeller fold protein YncE